MPQRDNLPLLITKPSALYFFIADGGCAVTPKLNLCPGDYPHVWVVHTHTQTGQGDRVGLYPDGLVDRWPKGGRCRGMNEGREDRENVG